MHNVFSTYPLFQKGGVKYGKEKRKEKVGAAKIHLYKID